MADLALEAILKRDNAVVASALLTLMGLAWLALLSGASTGMDPFAMSGWLLPLGGPAAESWTWTPAYCLIAFCMWASMMVAMMLPSASPLVLLYGRVACDAERKGHSSNPHACIAAFALGYLTLWTLSSAFAVALQWALERSGAMSAMMMLREPWAAGTLLIAAGLYQLTPLKLPFTLPLARAISRHTWAPRNRRRLAHGPCPRGLLPRLLRRSDAALVRGWRDESRVDRRLERLRARGEAPAARCAHPRAGRSPADGRRRRFDLERLRTSVNRTR